MVGMLPPLHVLDHSSLGLVPFVLLVAPLVAIVDAALAVLVGGVDLPRAVAVAVAGAAGAADPDDPDDTDDEAESLDDIGVAAGLVAFADVDVARVHVRVVAPEFAIAVVGSACVPRHRRHRHPNPNLGPLAPPPPCVF